MNELEQDKYSQKMGPDELEQDGTEDKPQNYLIAEKQFVIDVSKKRLEEEEEAYERQWLQSYNFNGCGLYSWIVWG